MFFEYWPVLIVDDEPDVLNVSQLAMKRFDVYGLPLKMYTAASRAEAIALLKDDPEVANSLAIAFLDVVMETDHAGLELCEYIRNELGNKVAQIIIRTGQPGLAPEREVIDKYDINGYFSKTEATQDKLYSLVKSGVRQYLTLGMAQSTIDLCSALVMAGGSRQRILEAVHVLGGVGSASGEASRWLAIDGAMQFAPEADTERGIHLLAELERLPGTPLSPFGDLYVSNADGYRLMRISPSSRRSGVDFLFRSQFAPPDTIVNMVYGLLGALAVAWHGGQ